MKIPAWYAGHARLLREPFRLTQDEVDWLTWLQVEELYLKPQRADNDAIRTESDMGSISGEGGTRVNGNTTTHGPQERPKSLLQFIAVCRASGHTGTDDELRRIYEGPS